MRNVTFTSYDQLPLTLRAEDIAQVLDLSRGGAYALMHRQDFPCIRIGKKCMRVERSAFLAWVAAQSQGKTQETTTE